MNEDDRELTMEDLKRCVTPEERRALPRAAVLRAIRSETLRGRALSDALRLLDESVVRSFVNGDEVRDNG